MNAVLLLGKLPPYSNKRMLIERKQSVHDIMREVMTAHRIFAADYDRIANDFWQGNVYDTAKFLWEFCKRNIHYKVEGEENQTTKSPAAILTQATGDCKHYSGFIGGVLDALVRSGKKIKWAYRFAAYNGGGIPEHVFIVINDNGKTIWIDPVLKSFNERLQPSSHIDKTIKMLTRISGIGSTTQTASQYPVSDLLDSIDYSLTPALYNAIQLLLKYGIMNSNAKINIGKVERYKRNPALYNDLKLAIAECQTAAIGGLFSTIWRGVKKVTLFVPRAAYLSLVSINAFGYATKLQHAIWNDNGTTTPFKDKIKDTWQNKLGGDWARLESTIKNGAKKKAILGAAPAVPAWVAAASAIIAAMTPLITAALKARQQQNPNIDFSIDPTTGLPYGTPQPGGGGIIDWVQNNPVIVAGGLAAIYFLTKKKTA